MRPFLLAAALVVLAGPIQPALAGAHAQLSVYDRSAGRELPIHVYEGRHYVAGEPGHAYEIRVRNPGSGRLLAVTSVDGVNVLSGDSAAPDQAGYVLDAHGETRIEGWRKSLSEVASFYFTRLPDAYAARTGRPDHVGVIGVAVFRERAPHCCRPWDAQRSGRVDAPSAERDARRHGSADAAAAAPAQKAERLGTGHGERLDSAAQQVRFERASAQPDQILTLYYDSRANLVAQGVIPRPRRSMPAYPNPFPLAGFVPDP